MSDCLFCKIINGDIPSTRIYEDDEFVIMLDIGPASFGHALLIPKEHYANLYEILFASYSWRLRSILYFFALLIF